MKPYLLSLLTLPQLIMTDIKTQLRRIGVDCVCSNKLDAFILNMRIIKDESEYQKILSAQKITEKSYLEVLNDVKPV